MELELNEMEKLYADSFKGLKVGSVTKGTVIQVKKDGIIVDISSKSEGFVPVRSLAEGDLETYKAGDEIEVYIERLSDADGFVKLSRQKAEGLKTWDKLEEALKNDETIEGKITGKVKGGMTVNISGVHAFLPGSHIDLKAPRDTDSLIGKTCSFKVINVNQKGPNVIVSRRALLEEERNKLRVKTLEVLKEGEIMKGTVKNLTDYGVFIDLGGIDGLLHISDMSWGRISHPGELFSIGDEVEVLILTFNRETEKVTLGYKQKKSDPWATAEEKYPVNQKVSGKVITTTEYGIFVELEEGIEGLIHVSELDWVEKSIKPSRLFSVGDTVDAMILKVSKDEKRISMSIKQLKPNPWNTIKTKYTTGQQISGKVKNFTDFGAFIALEEGIDALLHISDISWTKRIKHPSDVLKKGDDIEVVILSIESEKERISVSLKELTPNPWNSTIPENYKLGDTVKGKITNITDFGMFIEIEDGVEGLVHVSEVEKAQDQTMEELFKADDEVSARIININTDERKIDLSMKTMFG